MLNELYPHTLKAVSYTHLDVYKRQGYINKVNSASDKREYHLEVTQKFLDYYRINDSYIHEVMENIRKRFAPEDVKRLEEILRVIADELM